jgi:hypothetical protein
MTHIIRYILEHTPYQVYVIKEVADTNIPAMKLLSLATIKGSTYPVLKPIKGRAKDRS